MSFLLNSVHVSAWCNFLQKKFLKVLKPSPTFLEIEENVLTCVRKLVKRKGVGS